MDEVEKLMAKLKDPDADSRRRAAVYFAMNKDPRAVPALIETLKDDDYKVRGSVVYALGNMIDSRVIGPLIDALQDETYVVRWEAVIAVGKVAEQFEVDLDKIQASLQAAVKNAKAQKQEATKQWAAEAYKNIAKAVSERKKKEMPGVLSSGTVPKPSGKKIYRAGRVRVVA